jgi:hypothetical protein
MRKGLKQYHYQSGVGTNPILLQYLKKETDCSKSTQWVGFSEM